ncbi:MAG: (2Fe-2S)-binding protein [Nitrososphaeria archaeon]
MKISFKLNGNDINVDSPVNITLVDLLHDYLGETGVKKGCGTGECGSCTVLLDGKPVTSCLVLAPQAEGKEITTISGVINTEIGKKLMENFIKYDAAQCGYCIPGMVTTTFALLNSKRKPLSEDEIKYNMSGNLCRCGGYPAQIKAIKKTSQEI